MTASLKERVQLRLETLSISPTEAARLAGFEEGYVRDILRDRKTGVQGRNLERLAFALQCEPAYLVGEQAEPYRNHFFRPLAVPVVGDVAIGRWLEKIAQTDEYPDLSPFPEDSRYRGGQFELTVCDTSVNRFAQVGQRIRFVDPAIAETSLLIGDLVGITRFNGSGLRERTVRRLGLSPQGDVQLHLHTSDPAWQEVVPLVAKSKYKLANGETFQVDGLALYAYDPPHPQNQPVPIKFWTSADELKRPPGYFPETS